MKRPFELDVQRLKMAILAHAQRHDLDSEVLVAALADVLGLTAAVLDRQICHLPFETRMETFAEMARAAYDRTTNAAVRASVGTSVRRAFGG